MLSWTHASVSILSTSNTSSPLLTANTMYNDPTNIHKFALTKLGSGSPDLLEVSYVMGFYPELDEAFHSELRGIRNMFANAQKSLEILASKMRVCLIDPSFLPKKEKLNDDSLRAQILKFRPFNKLAAIKLYRDTTGALLNESKEAVEDIWDSEP